MATCASCPHACIFPGFLLLCSHSTASWNKQSKARERVVSQQRSAGPNLERQLAVPSSLQKSGIWRGAKPLLLPNTHEQTNGDPAGREKKALLPGEVFLVVKTESCRFWALRRINFPRREAGLPARPGFTNGRCHFGQETRSFCPGSPRTGAPIQMSRDR